MEQLFQIFMSDKRLSIVMQLIYLIMCIIITEFLVKWIFNMSYLYPTDISFAVVFNFVLTGQIIIPLFVFFAVIGFFHSVKNSAFSFYYFVNIRTKRFQDIKGFVDFCGGKFGWFYKIKDTYVKGKNYNSFLSLLADFDKKEQKMVRLAELFNSIVLSFTFTVWVCPVRVSIKIILTIITVLYFMYHTYNLFFLYKIQDTVDDYEEIKNKIEKRESNKNETI